MKRTFYLIIPLLLTLSCGRPFERTRIPIYRAPQKEQGSYFVVSADRANLRSGPGTNFEVISRVNGGSKYLILEAIEPPDEGYPWYRVQIDYQEDAWINGSVGYVEGEAYEAENVFNASTNRVSTAVLEGLRWMKWEPAFIDGLGDNIRLKEAYVYRREGKLLRIYYWPPVTIAGRSSIDDYLEKISYYESDFFSSDKVVFSQENMKVNLVRLSESQTEVEIDYRIKPYLESGRFGDQIRSKGYMESLLLEKVRENLSGASDYEASMR